MGGFDMRFADVVKCAANLVMPMGWKCTADFSALNYPICSFSFSLLSKICDSRPSEMFSPWNRCDVLSFRQPKPQKPQKCPNSWFFLPSQMCHYPRKDFDASWSHFRVFVEAYTLARPSVHTCIVIFQISGSSLPVPIFIGRRIDQINLQAEVTKSGMK